jgi:hypothetical protein
VSRPDPRPTLRATTHSPRRPRHAALIGAALAGAALALGAACERRNPAADRRSVVEQAVALAPEIEEATGLRFTAPPKVEVRTREQVRTFVRGVLEEPGAREELAGLTAAYRRLGAIPDSVELRTLLGRLLGEQVAGYYDPKSKTLYVVQGTDSATAAVTLRHELVHALQDQHRDLDSLLRIRGQADRATAAQAALEGQATWTQLGGGTDLAARMPGGWDRVRAQIRANAQRSAELGDAPLVVREGLLFPYLSGAELARATALAGHPDSVLRRLPESTEQVLHVERYLGSSGTPPDRPVGVTLPPPRAGQVVAENSFGEFDIRLVLFEQLGDLGQAARAAQGWGGDRWAVVRTGGAGAAGEALVWLTVWDAPIDAAEFLEAMTALVSERYPGARAAAAPAPAPAPAPAGRPGAGRRTTRAAGAGAAGAPAPGAPATAGAAAGGPASAAGSAHTFTATDAAGGARQLLLRATDVGGRPAVLYVDAPAAVGTDLVDPARATARP